MKKNKYFRLLFALILTNTFVAFYGQVPTCGSNVPYYQVNLIGNPAGSWISPSHQRLGNCCGTNSPDLCTSFEITLDTGAAMIMFDIASGAMPSGAMFYQINCGPQTPVGSPICISGPGPHYLTFCKPGNNENTYMVQSIPKPTFPTDQHVRLGCTKKITILGMDPLTTTWNSIYPGTPGQYNSYLSCTTGCADPAYTPAPNAPAYIDYLVSGTPIATTCGYVAASDTVRVYNHSAVTASVTPANAILCAGSPGVQLAAFANGGYGAYQFIWHNNQGTVIGTGPGYYATTAGVYSVEIRDELYDSTTCPATIISSTVTAGSVAFNVSYDKCFTAVNQNASLNVSVNGGNGGPYSVSLNNGSTYQPSGQYSFSVPINSTYTITVVDNYGCTSNAQQVVIPPALIANGTVTDFNGSNITCNGATDGGIDVTVSGGAQPYNYNWNTSATTQDLTGLGAGDYTLVVTDSNNCTATYGVTLTQPAPVAALSVTVSDYNGFQVSCYGESDGQIDLTTFGGTVPYTYQWSTGVSSEDISGLTAGTYSVVITDNNNCTSSSIITLNEPPLLTATITALSNYNGYEISCDGMNNGSIDLQVSGGAPSYSYSWNNGSSAEDLSSLAAGTYTVTIEDINQCEATAGITLSEPDKLSATLVAVSNYSGYNLSCAGQSDGSIDISVNGGVSGYTYAWSNGGASQDLANIGAGTYDVLVTDANGCTEDLTVILSEPLTFTVSVQSLTDFNGYDISCYGMDDGSVDLGVNGGATPYTYSWSNGATTQDLIKLTAGQYTVLITDANNCNTTVAITLTEPDALTANVSALTNNNGYETTCNGEKDAKVDLQVNGGVTTYTYQWNTGATTEDLSDVGAGMYSVTVTDQNGCSATGSILLSEPPQLVSAITGTSYYNGYNITCNGMNDGTVDITVSGGVAAYNYNWSNGTSAEDQSNLTAGNYSVTITDANGCTTMLSVSLSEPAAVNSTLTASSDYNGYNISCNGLSDGSADLQVNGGVLPYSYNWSNGNLLEDASGIPAGSYTVTVTDANNCKVSASVILSEPPQLSATALSLNDYNGYQIRCNGMSDGMIDVTVSGGVSTYTYAWSNGQTSEDLSSLSIGTYSVTITDLNNCTATASVSMSEPPALSTSYSLSDYNGYNISCSGLTDGSVDVSVSGGVAQYYYSWTNGATTEDQGALAAGTYSVSITDANGCSVIHTINLAEPDALSSFALATTNFNGYQVSCYGSSDANIDLNTTGGVAPLSYQWSNDANSEDLTGIVAGSYSVTITDLNNCVTTASIMISEPPAIQSTLSLAANYNGYGVSCHGMSDGALDLEVTGGTGAYTYSWSNGTTTQDLIEIPAGTYTVVVTDANNCSRTATLTVTEPAELSSEVSSISQYNAYNISCKGKTDGAIDAMTAGGVLGYTYTWSNGASTEDVNSISAGTYSLVVTDANNCSTTISVTLTEPEDLLTTASSSDFNGYSVSCHGSLDGSIDLNVSGGTGVYSYSWSNGSMKEDISSLGAGTYSVIVTDVNTCSDTLIFNLTQPDSVQVSASIKHVPCNGFSNGAIDLTVTGGVNDYTYNWTTDAVTEDIKDLQSGTYTVTITDKNNCISERIYTISETTPLLVNITHNNANCSGEMGSATVEVMGGTPGYIYTWSNGSNTPVQGNLNPGTYDVMVADANKCTKVESVTITEPDVLSSALTASLFYNGFNVSGYGASDGSVSVEVNGGTAPYTFAWSNGSDEEDLSNVSAGLYVVQITDGNGCTLIDSAKLAEPFVLAMPTGFSPNSDGSNDNFVVRGIENYPDNVIQIFNRWGAEIYEQDDYKNTWNGKSKSGSDLPEGTYFVILKLSNGPTLTGYVDLRR